MEIKMVTEELSKLLSDGELALFSKKFSEHFEFLMKWKLQASMDHLINWALEKAKFEKKVLFYQAYLKFLQNDIDECAKIFRIFMESSPGNEDGIKKILGENTYAYFKKIRWFLWEQGRYEIRPDFFKNYEGVDKLLIKYLLVSNDVIDALDYAWDEISDITQRREIFGAVGISPSLPSIKRWAQRKEVVGNMKNTLDDFSPKIEKDFEIASYLDLVPAEPSLTVENVDNLDQRDGGQELKPDIESQIDVELDLWKGQADKNQFLTDLPQLTEQTWDFQLARELYLDGEYYFCLIVLEFIKKTVPQKKADIILLLELERNCSIRLGYRNRIEKINTEISKLK